MARNPLGNLTDGMVTTLALVACLLQQPQAVQRPRDIWVFRSVLDKHARMLTVELHKDIYVAYDATYCGLYEAWTGDVKLDGSVYTTVHGPQPTSEGFPYISNDPDTTTWYLVSNGQEKAVKPVYRGYSLKGNQTHIQFDIPLAGGKFAHVVETPEAVPGKNGVVGLSRTFQVSGLPSSDSLHVKYRYRDMAAGTKLVTNAKISTSPGSEGWTTAVLAMKTGTTTLTQSFNLPDGWKGQKPDPRPAPVQDQSNQREPGLSFRQFWLGAAGDIDQLYKLVPGQTPNFSVVIPNVDLGEDSNYGQYKEHFVAEITGFLNAPEAGTYQFRLYSDDGSKLTINGQELTELKGLRGLGDAPGEASAQLKQGENDFRIDWFQNLGGIGVKLEWKKPGDSGFTTVPPSAFTTPKGEVRVTAPGRKRVFGQTITRPGDGQWLDSVHPSFDLFQAAPPNFHPKIGGIDFFPNGDMVVCCWEPDGGVYRISNYKGPADQIKVKRIGFGFAEPLGIKVVDGNVYVLQKQELTELIDTDGDGVGDEYKCIANGWKVTPNFHEFAFGLLYDKGMFYFNLAIAIQPGGKSVEPQVIDRGRVIEVDPKKGTYRYYAKGLRTPNGVGWGYNHLKFLSDNQGDWLPSSKILLMKEGAFYGNYSVEPNLSKSVPVTPPVLWLPQNEIGNSPSSIAPLNVGPYKNQMVHGDVTHGGLKRDFIEEVDGTLQGCVFRMTQGLQAGVNRVMLGPDGDYYIGGVGSTGDWGQSGKLWYGLQRLHFNGKVTFDMVAIRAKNNGMEIEFTKPLAFGHGETPAYYNASEWTYTPTSDYGGPKINEHNLTVKSVSVSSDRKRVFLEIPGMTPGYVVYIHTHPGLRSEDGQPIWTTEGFYTLNKLPKTMGKVLPPTKTKVTQKMSAAEKAAGFEALFDGTDLNGFKGYKSPDAPKSWSASNGDLVCTPGKGDGDLLTKEQYGDFDLRFSWRISKGGNSGVLYRVVEGPKETYYTGPEYQILDNGNHPDGKNPFTSASAIYALFAPEYDLTYPVGEWNESRIVLKGHKIQHYLNGVLVAEADTSSQLWEVKVANSKFKTLPDFAKAMKGFIVFQDHGNEVAYRNIRIKKL